MARALLGASAVGLLLVLGDGLVPVDGDDPAGRSLDEHQILLGEGPAVEAVVATSPILVEDATASDSFARWPGFAPHLAEGGVAAVFAFPMRVGGVRVGVLSVYRAAPGPLGSTEFADGLVIASLATLLLMVDEQGDDVDMSAIVGGSLESNSRFQIAAGIVSEQLDVPVADAVARIRAHAYATTARLDDVVRAVIDQTLVLEP